MTTTTATRTDASPGVTPPEDIARMTTATAQINPYPHVDVLPVVDRPTAYPRRDLPRMMELAAVALETAAAVLLEAAAEIDGWAGA
jgi:hypothetical protein